MVIILESSKNKSRSMLVSREDGFTISIAKFSDFPKFFELIDNLSEESKEFYDPWMFKKNPKLKIRLGQIVARFSLIPILDKIIKKIFPNGYVVILKCESPDGQLAGNMCMYNFKRVEGGKFMVVESKVIFDKFQNKGLSGFLTETFCEIAKKEGVRYVKSGTRPDNIRNKKSLEKFGWKFKELGKGLHEYKGKLYDLEIWILDLEK